MKKIKLPNFKNNNWFITLISTMVGVMAGFYLNNYSDEKKLINKKGFAFELVLQEIETNEQLLIEYSSMLKHKFDSFNYLSSKINENLEIIIHNDSLDDFKKHSKSIFSISNFEENVIDSLKIRGNMDLVINSTLTLVELSSINWDSYKQTDYLSITDFKCITEIETAYSLQERINKTNSEWTNILSKAEFFKNDTSKIRFLNLWKNLISEQNTVLEYYRELKEIVKNCS